MLTTDGLISYLKQTLNHPEAELHGELFSSGALDSVSMVNLLTYVEQSTGITIRAEDVTLENFDTPARILRFAEAAC
jgi:acyl carrier protein